MDRSHIPKVVASEMGTAQTHAMKSVDIFLREKETWRKVPAVVARGL